MDDIGHIVMKKLGPDDIATGQQEIADVMEISLRKLQRNIDLFDCPWERIRIDRYGRAGRGRIKHGYTVSSCDIIKERIETRRGDNLSENGLKGAQKLWGPFPMKRSD